MKQTYYDILGVSSDASQDEIKRAYRKLAFEFHPDRNPNQAQADVKMKELNFIYSILSDPQQREWYNDTIDVSKEFESQEEENFHSYYYSKIFCDHIVIKDSMGRSSKISVGQNIFYLVEIDKSIITWKYKSKEYFNLVVKNIFDPAEKENFAQQLKYNLKKTPLFLVHFGDRDIIIYKEDFENYWISEESYNKIDKKNGLVTAILISILIVGGFFYFYNKFSISEDQKDLIKYATENRISINNEDIEYLKKEYSVSNNELSYIDSDYYTVCFKEQSTTLESVELSNIPDRYGVDLGTVPEKANVEILLFCSERNAYKVRYEGLVGWMPGQYLNDPQCDNIFELNEEE